LSSKNCTTSRYIDYTENQKPLQSLREVPEFEDIHLPYLIEYQIGVINTSAKISKISLVLDKKAKTKLDLSHETMNMSHRAEAYVLMTKDVILHREVHLAKTHLLKLSDVNFTSTCSIIYHTAHDNREVLMKYGVGKASLMHLRASIDNYQAVMGAPKEAITKRKQLTHQLAQRIVEQRAILDKIYTLMSIMQYTQPAMYALYKDTWVVLYRSRSLAGMCRVTDATSAKAVAGATLTFYQDEVPVLKKSIAKGGGSRIKSLSNGTYILTVSRPGYTAQTLTVHISNTKLTTINVTLEKAL